MKYPNSGLGAFLDISVRYPKENHTFLLKEMAATSIT